MLLGPFWFCTLVGVVIWASIPFVVAEATLNSFWLTYCSTFRHEHRVTTFDQRFYPFVRDHVTIGYHSATLCGDKFATIVVRHRKRSRWNVLIQQRRQPQPHMSEHLQLEWNFDARCTVMHQFVASKQKSGKLMRTCWMFQLTEAQLLQQNDGGYPHPIPYKLICRHDRIIQFVAEYDAKSRICTKLIFPTHTQPRAHFTARWVHLLQRARTRILAARMVRATLLIIPDLAYIVALYATPLHGQYAIAPTYLEAVQPRLCL